MTRARLAALVLALFALPTAGSAGDWTSATRWSSQASPKTGPPRAIGSYGGGCVQGAAALPAVGVGFELLYPERQRHYGHPALVQYLHDLSARAVQQRLPALLVGDLSQPRGGPTPRDHASHQNGLDVDLAYTRPATALGRSLRPEERAYVPVVSLESLALTADWDARVAELLELAASDPAVERVFVSPAVKRALCGRASGPPRWVARLRPWRGHHDHFHVRLGCPAGSPDCVAQEAIPAGDGCGAELAWWFTDEARAPAPTAARAPRPALPPRCAAVLR